MAVITIKTTGLWWFECPYCGIRQVHQERDGVDPDAHASCFVTDDEVRPTAKALGYGDVWSYIRGEYVRWKPTGHRISQITSTVAP